MRVHLSTHFHAYAGSKGPVLASGSTVGDVFLDLDRQFPGLRFRAIDEQGRVRQHVKVYVNLSSIDDLSTPVKASDELHLLGALSGG